MISHNGLEKRLYIIGSSKEYWTMPKWVIQQYSVGDEDA